MILQTFQQKLYILKPKMKAIRMFLFLCLCFSFASTYNTLKITNFKTHPHEKKCYTQGLFFLNSTHVFQSCGLYNTSYYRVLKYEWNENTFSLSQTYKSTIPIDKSVFLQGATFFPKTNNIYILTWREKIVYRVSRSTFQIQQIQNWQKDGWGLTNNQTHMFVTDGGHVIYVVDQNFKIIEAKKIVDKNGKNLYNLNELQYVTENGKPFIYANVYMQRRIVKIEIESGKVVQEYDLLKIIQNEKGLKYDEVINGIAYDQQSGKFLLTGKNWGNFYLVELK